MDIRKDGYHARMKLSGVREPVLMTGSIMSILGQIGKHLTTMNPKLADKRINIEFAEHEIDDDMMSLDRKAAEVASMIDPSLITKIVPNDGETLDQLTERLINEGYDPVSASMFAHDAFNLPWEMDSKHAQWINDPQAARYRQLNSSQAAHDSADPSEYALLEAYCLENYHDFLDHMRIRK